MRQAFAALHHGQRPFVLPNAWDVASALLLPDAGLARSYLAWATDLRHDLVKRRRGRDGVLAT